VKHVYGPVPSRRLGRSLGVDPIPMKTCNWNCVYCQLGRTKRFTAERRPFVSTREIMGEVEAALASHEAGAIDWITLVGSGEPTLNSELGTIIASIKSTTDIPVAVITNGSLLSRREVRKELCHADAVLPSVDAGREELFRRINRPRRALSLKEHIHGLRSFRAEFSGEIWVEVMLLSGLNDDESALQEIAGLLEKISPIQIQLSYPERPPCESWVQPADQEGKIRALAILGQTAAVLPPTPQDFNFSRVDSAVDLEETLVGIITRHPIPEEEIRRHLPPGGEETLASLEKTGRVQRVLRYSQWFWTNREGTYGEGR
jgi:wyosine [tRNA(Phe)-imidazoG37] synthetase (radical SAM superfamily)